MGRYMSYLRCLLTKLEIDNHLGCLLKYRGCLSTKLWDDTWDILPVCVLKLRDDVLNILAFWLFYDDTWYISAVCVLKLRDDALNILAV